MTQKTKQQKQQKKMKKQEKHHQVKQQDAGIGKVGGPTTPPLSPPKVV